MTNSRPVPRRRSDPDMANYVYKSSNAEERTAKAGQDEPSERSEPKSSDKTPEK